LPLGQLLSFGLMTACIGRLARAPGSVSDQHAVLRQHACRSVHRRSTSSFSQRALVIRSVQPCVVLDDASPQPVSLGCVSDHGILVVACQQPLDAAAARGRGLPRRPARRQPCAAARCGLHLVAEPAATPERLAPDQQHVLGASPACRPRCRRRWRMRQLQCIARAPGAARLSGQPGHVPPSARCNSIP